MKFSQKLSVLSELNTFSDVLYLYLLRSNVYRILDSSIKDTHIRKLIKTEIQKRPESQVHYLDLKSIIHLVISFMKAKILSKVIGLEHPNVKRVIEIAEDIMSKNKILNVETLYNVAKKSLKLPRNGLLFIIQFLINRKILIEGSKFSKKTVLSNPTRRIIYDYIRANPGIHFSVLRKKALPEESGSSGQLVWHLEMLLKFNNIKKIKVGNFTVFIPFEMDEEVGKIFFLLRDRINKKIIYLIVENKTAFRSEIYKEIEEKREDVYYRINNLINHDIITVNETSNKEICVKSSLKELITKILKSLKLCNKNNNKLD